MNLLHNHFFSDLRFASIDYGKTNELGGKGSSLMRHINKFFFPKLKNYEIKLKKRTDIRTMP